MNRAHLLDVFILFSVPLLAPRTNRALVRGGQAATMSPQAARKAKTLRITRLPLELGGADADPDARAVMR